ncbi:sulfite exporter TauE/SafE family protein [Thiohalobacter sp. IOR34]|uniref:sulfite exporter TauE/SafE family protein n=1 Tax=Thiohalobacter sp. IOR34 TaxID=3057176 RepID=UPI0025B07A24|nr:sulfite exporter TauE/SafE family protein [Thiohalobacter sp. IOR34]WJW75364.1 sulfite exporter TauE/SafE family protein [Thiohalobacter sp. IOR34]
MDALLYLASGALAGLLAGLFGIGGGLVLVPVLAWLFARQGLGGDHLMHLAVGTSLATIVVTSLASLRAHHRRGAVDTGVLGRLLPGIVLGGLGGAWLADRLPTDGLRQFFGVFELLVALQMLLAARYRPHRDLPGAAGLFLAGSLIGGVSALLGIGGGTLSVPFLIWCSVPLVRAVGTSAAAGLPIALSGAAGFWLAGLDAPDLPPWSSGYIHWPAWLGISLASMLTAPLGAALAHRLDTRLLKRGFALVLALVGARMLGLWQ